MSTMNEKQMSRQEILDELDAIARDYAVYQEKSREPEEPDETELKKRKEERSQASSAAYERWEKGRSAAQNAAKNARRSLIRAAQKELSAAQAAGSKQFTAPRVPLPKERPPQFPEDLKPLSGKPLRVCLDAFCGTAALICCAVSVLLFGKAIGTVCMILGIGLALCWLFVARLGRSLRLQWFDHHDACRAWEKDYRAEVTDAAMEQFFAACEQYDEQYAAYVRELEEKRKATIAELGRKNRAVAEQERAATEKVEAEHKNAREKIKEMDAECERLRAELDAEMDARRKQVEETSAESKATLERHTLIAPQYFELAGRIRDCLAGGRADSLKEALNLAIEEDRRDRAEEKLRLEREEQLYWERFTREEMQAEQRRYQERQLEEQRRYQEEQLEAQRQERYAQEARDRLARRQTEEQAAEQARHAREIEAHNRRMEDQARQQAREQERHNREMERMRRS